MMINRTGVRLGLRGDGRRFGFRSGKSGLVPANKVLVWTVRTSASGRNRP